MIYTNIYSLPEPLASAIRNDPYVKRGDISATGLLRPPQMAALEIAHKDELTEDVSDGVWRLLGQAVHAIIERADNSNHLAEEALETEVAGWKVTGKPDLLDPDGVLHDWKVTSVYSFLLGDKPEWEAQLNIYRFLYSKYGFQVKKLQIVAILRDWVSSKRNDPEYPPAPVQVVDIPMWDLNQTKEFIESRVMLHKAARMGQFRDCSPEERWARPDTWAVMREGRKRALRVFDNEVEAHTRARSLGADHNVQHRPGGNIRCERFCPVVRWCEQAKALGVQVDY